MRYDINFDIEFRQISRVLKPFIGSGGQSSSSHCRNDTDLFKNHRKEKFAVKKVSADRKHTHPVGYKDYIASAAGE